MPYSQATKQDERPLLQPYGSGASPSKGLYEGLPNHEISQPGMNYNMPSLQVDQYRGCVGCKQTEELSHYERKLYLFTLLNSDSGERKGHPYRNR